MVRYLVLISLLSFPIAVNAEDSKDDSPEGKRCKAHVTAEKKNAFHTTCGENQGIAQILRKVHADALKSCLHSVRVVEHLKEKTAEITRDGTNDAKEMQAELKKIDSLSATDAMKKAKEANNTVLEKFQMKNAVIKHQLEQYSKIYGDLQKLEAAYDKAGMPLAHSNSHDGGACESEKQWWRGQVNSLDSEVTSVRKEAAANIQALNAIYQKNMTTIGASQKQAAQLTKSIAGMESLVKEDGSVDAKKSWWEKITGTDSPHEKEWVKTDCPQGSDQSACYDRAYKARSSSISDEAIGDISSPMTAAIPESQRNQSAFGKDATSTSGLVSGALGELTDPEKSRRLAEATSHLDAAGITNPEARAAVMRWAEDPSKLENLALKLQTAPPTTPEGKVDALDDAVKTILGKSLTPEEKRALIAQPEILDPALKAISSCGLGNATSCRTDFDAAARALAPNQVAQTFPIKEEGPIESRPLGDPIDLTRQPSASAVVPPSYTDSSPQLVPSQKDDKHMINRNHTFDSEQSCMSTRGTAMFGCESWTNGDGKVVYSPLVKPTEATPSSGLSSETFSPETHDLVADPNTSTRFSRPGNRACGLFGCVEIKNPDGTVSYAPGVWRKKSGR